VNLHLSDEQKLLQDSFQRFLAVESSIARVRAAEPLGFDRALWNGLAKMGALTMRAVGAEAADSSLLDAVLLMELAGKYLASAPVAEAITVARLLSSIGGEHPTRWLNQLGDGQKIITLALHEIDEAPDQFVPAGAVADAIVALEGDRLNLLIVSPPGAAPPNLGSAAIARLPSARNGGPLERVTLSSGPSARALYDAAVEEWKLLTSAALSAIAREAIALAAGYARERHAFGKPIGFYQAISHPLANLVTEAEGAQLLTWRAVSNIAEGAPIAAASISMAYWWAANVSGRAVAQSLHTFGGFGLSLECDIQLYHRRAKSSALLFGDPASELIRVGKRLWRNEAPAALPTTGPIGIEFNYGEKARELAAETRAFFERTLTPELRKRAHHSFDGHDWGVHRAAGRQGLLYPNWPTKFGGRDADAYQAAAASHVWDEFDWTINGVAVSNIVASMIMWFGTPEVQQRVLPLIGSGEAICSLGYTEPGSGSDVFAAKTRAVRDGDHWIVNGQKIFTSGANLAQYVLLLTRTDLEAPKHKGLTLFLVPLDSPGIDIQALYTYPDERTNITFYSDVRVSDAYRLGNVNGGLAVMTSALKLEQGGQGFIVPHRRVLERAVAWARDTGHHGVSALDDPLILSRLSRVAVNSEVSDVIFRRSLWSRVNEIPDRAYGPMSKLFSTEAFLQDATDLLDLTAPQSLLKGQEGLGLVERSHRHAAATTIYGGTSEVQRSLIAEKALGLPRTR
jgi:alkylation response protein AidB-like acyl-CoA dehydrogenase